ncbi:hypothetical protein FA95DRAFT_611289 [Auriscalpium vulgare]|uniref:Uncharacterized protein n=1 Tax=Auriscalpium vulgare TaxID=40419 RepID=A0ACB8RE57_9AGAM|nr:hypothetical protein FA95DRAFT_611289 [Auriscalpium vulgare]
MDPTWLPQPRAQGLFTQLRTLKTWVGRASSISLPTWCTWSLANFPRTRSRSRESALGGLPLNEHSQAAGRSQVEHLLRRCVRWSNCSWSRLRAGCLRNFGRRSTGHATIAVSILDLSVCNLRPGKSRMRSLGSWCLTTASRDHRTHTGPDFPVTAGHRQILPSHHSRTSFTLRLFMKAPISPVIPSRLPLCYTHSSAATLYSFHRSWSPNRREITTPQRPPLSQGLLWIPDGACLPRIPCVCAPPQGVELNIPSTGAMYAKCPLRVSARAPRSASTNKTNDRGSNALKRRPLFYLANFKVLPASKRSRLLAYPRSALSCGEQSHRTQMPVAYRALAKCRVRSEGLGFPGTW